MYLLKNSFSTASQNTLLIKATLGIQNIHIFEVVNDFTKDDLTKMKTPLEAGAKINIVSILLLR